MRKFRRVYKYEVKAFVVLLSYRFFLGCFRSSVFFPISYLRVELAKEEAIHSGRDARVPERQDVCDLLSLKGKKAMI